MGGKKTGNVKNGNSEVYSLDWSLDVFLFFVNSLCSCTYRCQILKAWLWHPYQKLLRNRGLGELGEYGPENVTGMNVHCFYFHENLPIRWLNSLEILKIIELYPIAQKCKLEFHELQYYWMYILLTSYEVNNCWF